MCKTPLPAHCGLHFSKRTPNRRCLQGVAMGGGVEVLMGAKGGVAAATGSGIIFIAKRVCCSI